MFYDIEEKSRILERKIRELTLKIEKLDQDIEDFFNSQDINPAEVSERLSNQANFTADEWDKIQRAKKLIDTKFDLKKRTIADPFKLKNVYKERMVQPHWIFVR